jgi:rare lipoprotein A
MRRASLRLPGPGSCALRRSGAAAALVLALASCKTTPPAQPGAPYETGIASAYHDSLSGRKTASGEPYDPDDLTCAHKKLKLGTVVEIRALRTGGRAVCRINDRGPFVQGRIIDMSRATAIALGVSPKDIAKVEIRIVK